MAKLSAARGFTKGVSVDVSYLKMNDFIEVNPAFWSIQLYGQSDFTDICHTGGVGEPKCVWILLAEKYEHISVLTTVGWRLV